MIIHALCDWMATDKTVLLPIKKSDWMATLSGHSFSNLLEFLDYCNFS